MDGASADSWNTNNLTVARNGSTINGLAADYVADVDNGWVEFIYDGTNENTWQVRTAFSSLGAVKPAHAFADLYGLSGASFTTTSGVAVATGLKVTITPSSTTSEVDITAVLNETNSATGNFNSFLLYANGVAIPNAVIRTRQPSVSSVMPTVDTLKWTHAPATTAAVVYEVYAFRGAGTLTLYGITTQNSTITVQEILK